MFRGKFIALNAYVREKDRFESNNLRFNFRKPEKDEKYKIKANRKK